jgi:hypothetical protein
MTLRPRLSLILLTTTVWLVFCCVEVYRYGPGAFITAVGGLNLGLNLAIYLQDVRLTKRRTTDEIDEIIRSMRESGRNVRDDLAKLDPESK